MTAYPEPYNTPVLPAGWPPLDPEDEASVLRACDENPQACRLRLRSLWDDSEFRVYCLDSDAWQGVCAATLFPRETADPEEATPSGRNSRLLAVALTPDAAARVAIDFLNLDLEADGAGWSLVLASRSESGD